MSATRRFSHVAAVLVALPVMLFLSGCGVDNERLQAERARLTLTDEPADALPVIEARELPGSDTSVVVVGQVGGVPEPWTEGQAVFVMADPSLMAETSGHDPAAGEKCTCPFCKAGKTEQNPSSLALVEFHDADGQPLAIDARKLFELAPHDTIVVRGRTRVNDSGYLVIVADGIYVRR